jgi:hypothetical protein
MRVSNPGALLDLALELDRDPAQARVAEGVGLRAAVVMPLPSRGVAPSETTTIENVVPRAWRRLMRSQTSSMSNGRSGTRITSRRPAMPL